MDPTSFSPMDDKCGGEDIPMVTTFKNNEYRVINPGFVSPNDHKDYVEPAERTVNDNYAVCGRNNGECNDLKNNYPARQPNNGEYNYTYAGINHRGNVNASSPVDGIVMQNTRRQYDENENEYERIEGNKTKSCLNCRPKPMIAVITIVISGFIVLSYFLIDLNTKYNLMFQRYNIIENEIDQHRMFISTLDNPKRDCLELYNDGYNDSRIYTIMPSINNILRVYCDQTTENGGWTVFQRRIEGNVLFNRNWFDYTYGFGDQNADYWLGNKYINLLSNNATELRIDIEKWDGKKTYAKYSIFIVDDEENKFKLHIGGYAGNAGDGFSYADGMMFSTKNNDHDNSTDNCANRYYGGWWYNNCFHGKLNGFYYPSSRTTKGCTGIHWRGTPDTYCYSLKRVEMKVRRKK